jgi:hypothetical protein
MTDSTGTTEDLELFDDAKEEFAGKEDLKDRLVAIWVTGKHGTRQGTGPGAKPYDWYETVTLVMDDGPNWNGFKVVDGEQREMLVASVEQDGPQRLNNFQYSQGGLTARLAPRVTGDKPNTFKPLRGRINSRPNSVKGRSPSWSIATPTDADKATSLKYADMVREISAEMAAAQAATDDSAFD